MKISVCMASYNGEKYILEQINSILKQIGKYDELIISDDNSGDNTVEIIKSVNDSRIKLFENETNVGYSRNFERAIKKATGDIIFLSDQDDVWLDNKVRVTLKYLEKYDFVVSDAHIVNEKLEIVEESRNKKYRVRRGFLNNWLRTRYIGCCMAFKKKVLKKLGKFPRNSWMPHDLWIALICEFYYKSFVINQPLILYRRHHNNVSAGGEKENRSLVVRVVSRFYTLFCVIGRMFC